MPISKGVYCYFYFLDQIVEGKSSIFCFVPIKVQLVKVLLQVCSKDSILKSQIWVEEGISK